MIAPVPGGHFTHAGLAYDSVYGTVESSWRREGEKVFYEITIPANCTASIRLPGEDPREVKAGTYCLEQKEQESQS